MHRAPASNISQHKRPHSNSWVGTPSIGLFSGSRDFDIKNTQFNDFSQNVYNLRGRTQCLEHLQQFISESALHDSLARFPPPKCHPKTREKVLKVIMDWVNDPRPRERIMWLNGPAGAGKSAIAQTIAGKCSDEQLAASFFFLRNSSDRGSATRLFTTLAWQLAKNIPQLLSYVEFAIETEYLLHTKSLDIQLHHLIVQPFQKLLHDNPDFFPARFLVIIDGVDECSPDQDQLLLLRLVAKGISEKCIPLRFLICSRPEFHIQEAFESDAMTRVTHTVRLDDRFEPNDDIRRYLKDEFARIYAERTLSSAKWPPDDKVIEKLVSKSSGQFIYASTVVKFINDIDGDPSVQLDIVLNIRPVEYSSPFAQLDQLYIHILSQQPSTRLLRDLFVLIIALRQPEITFVCRRLRISREDLERKLRRLRSLIKISGLVIETYHLSIHDFFQDKRRSGKYFIRPIRIMFVRLPHIMRSMRKPMFERIPFFPQLTRLTVTMFAVLVCGTRRPTTTFVNSISAYLIMLFFLDAIAFCLIRAGWDPVQENGEEETSAALACAIIFFPHLLSLYRLFRVFRVFRFIIH